MLLVKCVDLYFQIRLIVIDSFSYLFRSLDSDVNLVQMTHEILLKLQQIAEEFECAVSNLRASDFIYRFLKINVAFFVLTMYRW